jgi:hypothetical protein
MNENERLKEVIDWLIANRKVRNQQEFSEEISSDRSSISNFKNGKRKIADSLSSKIESAFPYINIEWLKTGEGEMIKQVQNNNVTNNPGIVGIQGRNNTVTNHSNNENRTAQDNNMAIINKLVENNTILVNQIAKLIEKLEAKT